jgi:hypothetical protein
MPLLYRWLKESGSDQKLPHPAIDRIKASVFRLAARNITLAQEAVSILQAFETRQIPCAPVRGLALAELLYGDITARPMGDLDLLVRKEDLPTVAAALMGLGFQEIDRRPGFAQDYSNTLEFVRERHGGMIVEPHWTIAYPPFADRIDMEAVWRQCVRGRAVGVDAWLLSREDLLLHLCFHLIHRGESAPLLWFYELDRLIRQTGDAFNWPQVVQVSREAGQALLVIEALGLVKGLFETPIPAMVFSQLEAPSATHPTHSVGGFVESRVVRLLAGDSRADGRESLALFFMIKGVRAKARYAVALLFPSSEFMRLHYGLSSDQRLGFHYLARLASCMWQGLKGIGFLLAPHRMTCPSVK